MTHPTLLTFPAQYVDFHVKTMLDIAQQQQNPLVLMVNENMIVGSKSKRLSKSSATAHRTIDSDEDFLNALKSGACIAEDCLEDYTAQYFMAINQSNDRIKGIFLNQVAHRIFDDFDHEQLNILLPQLNQNQSIEALQVFRSFWRGFDHTISLIKRFPNHQQIISDYLANVENNRTFHNQEKVTIVSAILKEYPDEIERFAHLKVVKEYLAQHAASMFEEDIEEKIFHLKIGLKTVQQKCLIPSLSQHEYGDVLAILFESLKDKKDLLGVKHLSQSNNFDRLVVYVHATKDSPLSHHVLHAMVEDFLKDIPALYAKQKAEENILQEYSNAWLSQYFLAQKVNDSKAGKTRANKI